jgi:hypothetical protein
MQLKSNTHKPAAGADMPGYSSQRQLGKRWYISAMATILVFIHFSLVDAQESPPTEILESTTGKVEFISDAPLELIKAASILLRGFINPEERTFAFSVPTGSFKGFNSPLQQEHFYENYIESHKYPTATFNGRIIESLALSHDSIYTVRAKGTFDIHGVKAEKIIKINITVEEGKMTASADFYVLLADHNIIIPKMVHQKIAEKIRVKVELAFDLTKNE